MYSVSNLSKINNSSDNIKQENYKAVYKFGCLNPLHYNLYCIKRIKFWRAPMHKSPLNPLLLCTIYKYLNAYGHAKTRVVLVYYPLQVLIIDWFKMFVNQTQVQADFKVHFAVRVTKLTTLK